MVVLSVSRLSKYFGSRCLFDQISFSINGGDKVGIVGPNGAGKTTLFQILTGELACDEGQVFMPGQLNLGVQHQMPEMKADETVHDYVLGVFEHLIEMEKKLRELEQAISDAGETSDPESVNATLNETMADYAHMTETFESQNGYGFRSEVRGVLNGLGFYGDDFDRSVLTLSGGQKTRLALGRLLLTRPDILLLDEPTNHLDIESVEWLENFLRTFTGTVLAISHDRYFLDQVTERTLEIEHGKVTNYRGGYSEALKKKTAFKDAQERNARKAEKEILRQEEIVRRMKQHGTEKLANRAKSREKKLIRMDRPQHQAKQAALSALSFQVDSTSGRQVLAAENLSMSWEGESPLFTNVSFTLQRTDRVALVGPNGIGKTTLFRIAAGDILPDSGSLTLGHQVSLGYYHQELKNLDESLPVIEELHSAYPQLNETQLRTWLGAFLFTEDEVFTPIHLLSGGEKARLSLLKLMLSKHNLLLLDEPTNHLDIPARENLEDALLNYDGTLFFISHDRYFINRIATAVLEFSQEGLIHYLGNYDDYQTKKRQLLSLEEETPAADSNRTRQKQEKQKERQQREENRALKNEVAALEAVLHGYERRLKELEDLMCRPEIYADAEESKRIHQESADIQKAMEKDYHRWESLLELDSE
ncbi:MAG: ATP-binding cassette domain-containing protein [Bacillota bacterium]|nr:ATP-binding cassette domain-containing protein [Bacillota bacterium]MDW7676668.1 ATP-binding cassette domain-containing protein [Bacillota bacterium]